MNPDLARTHSHVPAKLVLTATGITLLAGAVELLGAWRGRSLFLAADAIHLVAHLGIFGVLLIPPGRFHERGEDVTTVAVLLLVLIIAMGIAYASIRELISARGDAPEPLFMLLALIGLVANLATAYLLRKPAENLWSFRAALAHELSDGALTVVGLLGVPAIKIAGWPWVDPGLSLMIGAWLMAWSGRLLIRRVRGGPKIWGQETGARP
ncbi:MAG TPA: cation transporter [Planctomycetota bacterium]|nr:cation transporter [Planctomycetota bacterium]